MSILYVFISVLGMIFSYLRGASNRKKGLIVSQRLALDKFSAFIQSTVAYPGEDQYWIDYSDLDAPIKRCSLRTVNIAAHNDGTLEVVYIDVNDKQYNSYFKFEKAMETKKAYFKDKEMCIVRNNNKYSNCKWDLIYKGESTRDFYETRAEAEDARDRYLISKMANFSKQLKKFQKQKV